MRQRKPGINYRRRTGKHKVSGEDHGEVTIAYGGSGKFKRGTLMEFLGPCPPGGPGRYEITVKALDADKVIIGIGSKERYFPEEK